MGDTEMMDNWKGIQQQNEEEEERKMRYSAKKADRISFFICMIYFVAICFWQPYARVILEPTIPIAFADLIPYLTNAGEGKGIVNKFCRSKYGQFIGRISMSLYLTHMLNFSGFFHVLVPALQITVWEFGNPLRILILVPLLLLTGASSYLLLKCVEDPCRKKIRQLIPADDAGMIRQSVPSTTPGEEPPPIRNSADDYEVQISS